MAINAIYTVQLDTDRDNTWDNAIDDITAYVLAADWTNGMAEAWETVGGTARMNIVLNNAGGNFSPEDAGATYYNKLLRGVLVRIRATDPTTTTTTTLCTLKVDRIQVAPGSFGERRVILTAQDPMWQLLASDYNAPLLTDTTADAVLTQVFDSGVVVYPYHKTFWIVGAAGSSEVGQTTYILNPAGFIALDAGKSNYPYVGDNTGGGGSMSAQASIREVMEPEMGRFWWNVRTSKATFHNRHRDMLNDTIDLTLTSAQLMTPLDYRTQEDIVNRVIVNYEPRATGTAGSILWSLDNTGRTITPGETAYFRARFTDPDSPGTPCGAQDIIEIVKSFDTYINNDPSGDPDFGDSWALYTVGMSVGGGGADVWIQNTSYNIAVNLYVHKLQIRGTPITRNNRASVLVQDAASIRDYDLHEKTLDLPLVNTDTAAKAYANTIKRRYLESITRFNSVSFDAGQTTALMTAALTLGVGNQVTVQDTFTSHNSNYVIVGEQHSVQGGAVDSAGQRHAAHRVTWILKPKARDKGWRIGIVGFSEVGQTTVVVY